MAEIERPTIAADEVLVQVHAAGLDRGTWHLMAGMPYAARLVAGLRAPKNPVPGLDVAGVVAAVGGEVTRFQAGDEVFGVSKGSFAEFAAAREDKLARKPSKLTFEQAAAVPVSGMTALRGLSDVGHLEARTEGADRRCVGWCRQLRRADRQGTGSGGHRCLQHEQGRPGALARRRPRHRLHQGRLRRRRDAVRPDPRRWWQLGALTVAAGAHSQGHARHCRRRRRRQLDRHGSATASACTLTVRRPATDHPRPRRSTTPSSSASPN